MPIDSNAFTHRKPHPSTLNPTLVHLTEVIISKQNTYFVLVIGNTLFLHYERERRARGKVSEARDDVCISSFLFCVEQHLLGPAQIFG